MQRSTCVNGLEPSGERIKAVAIPATMRGRFAHHHCEPEVEGNGGQHGHSRLRWMKGRVRRALPVEWTREYHTESVAFRATKQEQLAREVAEQWREVGDERVSDSQGVTLFC